MLLSDIKPWTNNFFNLISKCQLSYLSLIFNQIISFRYRWTYMKKYLWRECIDILLLINTCGWNKFGLILVVQIFYKRGAKVSKKTKRKKLTKISNKSWEWDLGVIIHYTIFNSFAGWLRRVKSLLFKISYNS